MIVGTGIDIAEVRVASIFGGLVGADDRVVGVEDESGGGIVQLRRLIEGLTPVQSKAPEAPSTGARPSPDLRVGNRPGLTKPMSPSTSA